jgi:hypothetical protein
MATFSSTRMSAEQRSLRRPPTKCRVRQSHSTTKSNVQDFRPGEPLQITMKCNAASARPQRLQTARARDDSKIDRRLRKAVIDALVDKTKPGTVFYSSVYGS